MNLSYLEWFCYAFQACSFTKAAEQAFVSRQAFGKAIKNLEAELGASLFERDAAGVKPTELAELIYPQVVNCVRGFHSVKEISREYLASNRLKIRFSFADGMIKALPQGFLDELETSIPEAEFLIEKHYAPLCLNQLEQGEVDFVICSNPVRNRNLHEIPLATDELYVAVSKSLLDLPPEDYTLESLQSVPFFSLGTDFPDSLGFTEFSKSRGLVFQMNNQYQDYDVVVEEVNMARGATIIPKHCLNLIENADIATFPFPDSDYYWKVCFYCLNRNYSTLEQKVIDFMADYSKRFYEPHSEKRV